jgi:hypothetical protein
MLMDPMISTKDGWIYRCRRGRSWQSNVSEVGQIQSCIEVGPAAFRSKSFSVERRSELGFRMVCNSLQRK